MKPPLIPRRLLSWVSTFILCSLLFVSPLPAQPQTAQALNQVRKLFVETSDGKQDATELQQRLIDNLRKDHSIEVVTDQTHADAILKAKGETWVRGYISVNPRSPGSKYPVYSGFLSAQLIGKDSETLWSYLVTPSKYEYSGIRQDLADQLVKHLETALHSATPASLPAPGATRVLKAAGASFSAPLYQAWIESFRQRHPDIQITYDSIGSEAGIQRLRDKKITFAASDVPLSDAQMARMPGKILQFATVIGAVVPIYHLPEAARDLRFTPEILAGIYLGKIRRWNDPAIKAANHGLTLPDADIVVIHRADGSGTTFAWTGFLSKTDPTWKTTVGSGFTVNWPVGRPAQGNDGIASMVDQTPNSIGYAELSYAIQRALTYGTVRNAAGNFVQANLISLAAAASSTRPASTPPAKTRIPSPASPGSSSPNPFPTPPPNPPSPTSSTGSSPSARKSAPPSPTTHSPKRSLPASNNSSPPSKQNSDHQRPNDQN
jgi:phosphate transport system substrate-binding protein